MIVSDFIDVIVILSRFYLFLLNYFTLTILPRQLFEELFLMLFTIYSYPKRKITTNNCNNQNFQIEIAYL